MKNSKGARDDALALEQEYAKGIRFSSFRPRGGEGAERAAGGGRPGQGPAHDPPRRITLARVRRHSQPSTSRFLLAGHSAAWRWHGSACARSEPPLPRALGRTCGDSAAVIAVRRWRGACCSMRDRWHVCLCCASALFVYGVTCYSMPRANVVYTHILTF